MTQEELKDLIFSRITLNKEYWKPKIDAFFKENPIVTRESFDGFFEKWRKINNSNSSSPWVIINKRSQGIIISREDFADTVYQVDLAFDELELIEFQSEMNRFVDQFRIKAVEAFKKNDRYTCGIYYTLYAIASNKELKTINKEELKDINIKRFIMERVLAPSLIVTSEITLVESQKKDIVDSVFDRSSFFGFGRLIAPLDFSMVENNNLPFETNSNSITFFDFIGICKEQEFFPDIRNI